MRARAIAAVTAVLAVVLAVGACSGEVGTIAITVVTAPDTDLLDEVTRVRVSLSDPERTVEAERQADGSFDLSLEVDAHGDAAQITVEGFDAGGALIAIGRTGPLPVAAIDADIVIYLAPPLSIAEAPVTLDPPRSELAAAQLSFGVLLAGGRSADGPTDDMVLYNVFDHDFQVGDPLPAPRAGMTAVAGSSGLVYLFGGENAGGEPTADAYLFDTTAPPAGFYEQLPSDDAYARAGAAGAAVGGEVFLVTGDPPLEINGFSRSVVALDEQGPLTGTATTVFFEGAAITLIAGSGAGDTGLVLRAQTQFASVEAPASALRDGHGTVVLPDGDFLVVGGATIDGPVRSAVRVDPLARTASEIADVLATPRTGAAIAATSAHVVVAGGSDAGGAILGDVEVLEADTLFPTATLPLLVPRTGATATALANGQVVVLGGTDADGDPVGTIELFTPGS